MAIPSFLASKRLLDPKRSQAQAGRCGTEVPLETALSGKITRHPSAHRPAGLCARRRLVRAPRPASGCPRLGIALTRCADYVDVRPDALLGRPGLRLTRLFDHGGFPPALRPMGHVLTPPAAPCPYRCDSPAAANSYCLRGAGPGTAYSMPIYQACRQCFCHHSTRNHPRERYLTLSVNGLWREGLRYTAYL